MRSWVLAATAYGLCCAQAFAQRARASPGEASDSASRHGSSRAEGTAAGADALSSAEEARARAAVGAPPPPPPPPPPGSLRAAAARARAFWRKFHGDPSAAETLRPAALEAAYAGVSACLAICALAGLHVAAVHARTHPRRLEQLVAPFGASAVLVFSTPTSPLAQPRNLVGGNTLAALVGVAVSKAFQGRLPWLAAGVAVGLATFGTAICGVMHPPAGAMALAALARDPGGQPHGFLFALMPACTGSCLLLALLSNNTHPRQRYPQRWL
jgi:CBS-domain-containing membrane protein